MIQIFGRFFDFCGETNKRKFITSIFLGVLKALFEALKIPAIAVTLHGVLSGNLTVQHILLSFGIMLFSVAGHALTNYHSTMLQCEAGYGTCADKRIEIAEHLKYLPMGYFNRNSLGYITSVATNSMEALADVAARVVMMETQGILTTVVVVLMILFFDLRIGGIAISGVLLFFAANSYLQKKAKEIAPVKDASDRKLVEKVLEYIQGIAEVRSYNLTGDKSRELKQAIDDNAAISIKTEVAFVPVFIMALPDGYETLIGEGGANLSGGEKQRISIARAIMKDAPIIILDEATANVDPESEQELTTAIEALTKEKTILMIAHRLKTVRHADKILVIDGGRIVRSGTHEQLIGQNGIYRRFVQSRELAVDRKV